VRIYVRELLKDGPTNEALALLAHAIGENPDADDLLMLVDCEVKRGRSFLNWRSVQIAVTEQVSSKDWQGAYNIVPVPVVGLRPTLLALTVNGAADAPPARCLNAIDKIRDEYGAPETEPRHPDLASGRTWPILMPMPMRRTAISPFAFRVSFRVMRRSLTRPHGVQCHRGWASPCNAEDVDSARRPPASRL
jgi:NACHT conflict system protein